MNAVVEKLMGWPKAFWSAVVAAVAFLGKLLRAVFNFALCIALRPVLLLLIVLLAILPLLVVWYGTFHLWDYLLQGVMPQIDKLHCLFVDETCGNSSRATDEPDVRKLFIALLGLLGGIPALFTVARGQIAKALRTSFEALKGALRVAWFPMRPMETTVGEALDKHISPVFTDAGNVIKSWPRTIGGIALAGLVFGLAFFSTDEVGDNVTTHYEKVKNIVKNSESTENRIYFLDWAAPSFSFEKGAIFSLVFPPEGDLDKKAGICPANHGVTMKWLREFRKALATCPKQTNGDGLQLEIKAYSSIAPVISHGTYDNSDELNCEIANQRADAIARLLVASEPEFKAAQCKAELESAETSRADPALCKPSDAGERVLHGSNFTLRYTPWTSFEDMHNARPMNDCCKKDAELFNRVVQIIVKNEACWREQSHLRNGDPRGGIDDKEIQGPP